MMKRCGCELGRDCDKTTVCELTSMAEDHEAEIADLIDKLAMRDAKIERLQAAYDNLDAWCEQTNPDAYEKWRATHTAWGFGDE